MVSVSALVFAVLVLTATHTHAECDCTPPDRLDAVDQEASLVFTGKIVGVKQKKVSLSFDVGQVAYLEKDVRFVPDSVVRGAAEDTVAVLFYEGREDCETRATDFTFGERYALSAVTDGKGRLVSNDCCLLKKLPRQKPVVATPVVQPEEPPPADTIEEPEPEEKPRKSWFRRLFGRKKR